MKRVTLKEVARQSGVSVSLVSKVLKNDYQTKSSTSREKIETVQKVAARLGYVADKNAQKLRYGKGKTIAVAIPVSDNFENSIYPQLMIGIINRAKQSDYDFVFFHNYAGEKEYENLLEIAAMNPDGIIYAVSPKLSRGAQDRHIHMLNALASKGLPILFCMEKYDTVNAPSYQFDDYAGGYMGTRYLLDKGYTRIAFCKSPFDERFSGYQQALSEKGIHEQILPFENPRDPFLASTGYAFFKQLYQTGQPLPEAIFATCDMYAIGIFKAMKECGLTDEDICVLGFDGLSIVDSLEKPFPSVMQPVKRTGFDCADAMIRWIENNEAPQNKLYKPEIRNP